LNESGRALEAEALGGIMVKDIKDSRDDMAWELTGLM
jgi:hypothetical protein